MSRKSHTTRPTLAALQQQYRLSMPDNQDPSKLPAFMKLIPRKPSKPTTRKHEEHDEQARCVTYLHKLCPNVVVSAGLTGELWGMARHVPRGIFYGWIAKLKARGMLSGYSDLVLHWHDRHTIFLEMKTKTGVESSSQEGVRKRLEQCGFSVYRCESVDDLKRIIAREHIPCLDAEIVYE